MLDMSTAKSIGNGTRYGFGYSELLRGNHTRTIQWCHFGPSRMTHNKVLGQWVPNLVNPFTSLKLMKLAGQKANLTRKNSDIVKMFSQRGWGGQYPN